MGQNERTSGLNIIIIKSVIASNFVCLFFIFRLGFIRTFQKPHEMSFTLDQMLIGKR